MKTRRDAVLLILLTLAVCGHAFGLHHNIVRRPQRTGIRRAHLRRLRWNPLFCASRDSLLRQNEEIDRLELPRSQDDDELENLNSSEDLVPIIANQSSRFDSRSN